MVFKAGWSVISVVFIAELYELLQKRMSTHIVIGVEHSGDVLCLVSVTHSADVLSTVD